MSFIDIILNVIFTQSVDSIRDSKYSFWQKVFGIIVVLIIAFIIVGAIIFLPIVLNVK